MKFYGFDGDRIGKRIETLLIKGEIIDIGKFSNDISTALERISETIVQQGGKVIFCGGDSIMFQGQFENTFCEELLALFLKLTGCTASMGIGASSTDAYLALKLAKAEGGGKMVYYQTSEGENDG